MSVKQAMQKDHCLPSTTAIRNQQVGLVFANAQGSWKQGIKLYRHLDFAPCASHMFNKVYLCRTFVREMPKSRNVSKKRPGCANTEATQTKQTQDRGNRISTLTKQKCSANGCRSANITFMFWYVFCSCSLKFVIAFLCIMSRSYLHTKSTTFHKNKASNISILYSIKKK